MRVTAVNMRQCVRVCSAAVAGVRCVRNEQHVAVCGKNNSKGTGKTVRRR